MGRGMLIVSLLIGERDNELKMWYDLLDGI